MRASDAGLGPLATTRRQSREEAGFRPAASPYQEGRTFNAQSGDWGKEKGPVASTGPEKQDKCLSGYSGSVEFVQSGLVNVSQPSGTTHGFGYWQQWPVCGFLA